MSNDKYLETELQLMEVSQDCTSEAHMNKRITRPYAAYTQYADDWDASWDEEPDEDEFIEIEDIVDADMDAEILDFDEY